MLEISALCSVLSCEDYFYLSCFFIVENPPLMKHFCDSGINAVNNHCAVGQQVGEQRFLNCCLELENPSCIGEYIKTGTCHSLLWFEEVLQISLQEKQERSKDSKQRPMRL